MISESNIYYVKGLKIPLDLRPIGYWNSFRATFIALSEILSATSDKYSYNMRIPIPSESILITL